MRNAEPYIKACLLSVLDQGGGESEIITVDDGSTDRSREIVEKIADTRIRIVDGPCTGISGALNTGFAEARGSIMVRCDADDLYAPGRLQWQSKWLLDNPDVGAVCGSFAAIDKRGRHVIDFPCGKDPANITDELCSGKVRTHLCTFAIRREVADRVGGYRSFFKTGEDVDYQLRLGEACRVMYAPYPCYSWRIHSSSITHGEKTTANAFYEAMARTFQHERLTWGRDALQTGKIPETLTPF